MAIQDNEDDFFDDFEDSEFDEDELLSQTSKEKKLNWRRIEFIKEQMALRQALSDFDDYHV